jgi:hypothetical protein
MGQGDERSKERRDLMRAKPLIVITVILLGGIGFGTTPVAAEHWDYIWDHPCSDDPGSTLVCASKGQQQFLVFGYVPEECWCVGEWDNTDHWVSNPDGYPSEVTDIVRISHSNIGYCDGGDRDGDPCSADAQCPPNPGAPCENKEEYLKLDVVTEAIHSLELRTTPTDANQDKLEIRFVNYGVCSGGTKDGDSCDEVLDCPGGTCTKSNKTLNVGTLVLDATHGPIEIRVQDPIADVQIKTDTTD